MPGSDINDSDYRLKSAPANSFIIAACLALVFALCFEVFVLFDKKPEKTLALEQRINPNNASAASLMRLPGTGSGRANAIIEYRNKFQRDYPDEPAFSNCDDLLKIKGIGPVIAAGICQHLKFEGQESALHGDALFDEP